MELNPDWQMLGSLSELIGAIVVIGTLIYAARQIRQVNAQSQASARYSFIESYGQMNLAISGNKQLASVFRRGLKGLELDEDEHYQFFALLGQFLNTWSALYDLHEEKLLPENQWDMVRMDILVLLNEPGGRAFWDGTGKHGVHETFRSAVEKALAAEDMPYTMDRRAPGDDHHPK